MLNIENREFKKLFYDYGKLLNTNEFCNKYRCI